MSDGLMSREEREAIRSYVDPGPWNDGASGHDILALLAHADAADKLLREARDVLNQITGGTYGWAACDVSTKITRAIGDGNG